MAGLLSDHPNPDTRASVSRWLGRASILDIETTGLDPSLPGTGIWQAAVGSRTPQGLEFPVDVLVRPTFLSDRGESPISQGMVSAFSREAMGRSGIGTRPWDEGIPRSELVPRILSSLRGRDLWVQNLPFESRHLAANMTDAQWQAFVQGAGLEGHAFRPGDRRIMRSSILVERAMSQAWRNVSSVRSKAWAIVWPAIREELERDVPMGTVRSFDIQDVTRSMFALAQERGAMPRTGDIFSGSSVDVFSRLALGAPEAHLARQDVAVQDVMLERHLSMAESLWQGRALSGEETGWLRAISDLQPAIRRANAARTLGEAWRDISLRGSWDVVAGVERAVRTVGGQRKEYARFVHAPLTDIGEVVRHLGEREAGIPGLRRDLRVDWGDLEGRFRQDVMGPHLAGGSLEDLLHAWKGRMDVPDEVFARAAGGGGGGPAERFGRAWSWGRRNWRWLAAGALGAGILWNVMGGSDPEGWHGDLSISPPSPSPPSSGEPRQAPSGPQSGWEDEIVRGEHLRKIGLNPNLEGRMMLVSPSDKSMFEIEDADTVLFQMGQGRPSSWRLAGIDAPEISHSGEAYAEGRVFEDQPWGMESKRQAEDLMASMDQVGMLWDPRGHLTYGRGVGVLMGVRDGQVVNLNLELARIGAASYLPFGKRRESLVDAGSFRRAEAKAASSETGMWSEGAWRIERVLTGRSRRRLTHVSLTMPERLRDDFQAAVTLAHMKGGDRIVSDWQATGTKEDFNILEGMGHGWFGSQRRETTDFGSGWKGVVRQIERGLAQVESEPLWNLLQPQEGLKPFASVTTVRSWMGQLRTSWRIVKGRGLEEEVAETRSWLRQSAAEGLSKVGFVSPGLEGEELRSTILHERVHVHLPGNVELALAALSKDVVELEALPTSSQVYSRKAYFLEEVMAYGAEGIHDPGTEERFGLLFAHAWEGMAAHLEGRGWDPGGFAQAYAKIARSHGGRRAAKVSETLSKSVMDRSSAIKHHRMDSERAFVR